MPSQKQLKFKCGCEFEIFRENGEWRVQIDADINKLNLECPATWKLLSDGNSLGCFQLETQFGQSTSKSLKPENLVHIAALVSVLRPGCSEAKMDGKTVKDRYIDRKNKQEEVSYHHPALEIHLRDTFGLMIYQEQALAIVKDIAGFTLQDAELLRKAASKKDTSKMAEVRDMFMTGAKKVGKVTDDEAKEIFSTIQKSQRYAFNKSHAFSYAKHTFVSAYIKSHFPISFFTSWLYWSSPDFEEIAKLTRNARSMGIPVNPLDFRVLNPRFKKFGNSITFGTSDIRGIGLAMLEDVMTYVVELEEQIGPRHEWEWIDFLLLLSPKISITAAKALIGSGAVDYFKLTRTAMLYEVSNLERLTDRELGFIQKRHLSEKFPSLLQALSYLLNAGTGKEAGISRKDRIVKVESLKQNIENPPFKLVDSPAWKAGQESALYGLPLTCSTLDQCDITEANCSIKQFVQGQGGFVLIPAQVTAIKEHIISKGNHEGEKMAFLSISDKNDNMENVVAFSEIWKECSDILTIGNNVMIGGKRGKNASLVVENVFQL